MDLKGNMLGLLHFLTSDKRITVGLGVIIVLVFMAVLVGYLTPYRPGQLFEIFSPPSIAHPMGTDHIGRDVFTLVMYGIRVSLTFGSGAAFVSIVLGILVGAVAGYFGGLIDDLLSKFTELFMIIPTLLLVILAVAMFGTNMYTAMLCVGLTIWPSNAKIMRVQVLSLKSREYVESAKLAGASHFRLLTRHILPNGMQPVIANTTLLIGTAILAEAALSFLGLGDLNNPSWGQVLYYAKSYIRAWWLAVFPGLFIMITIFAFNLFGDGLNVILNPRHHTKRVSSKSIISRKQET